MLSVIIRTRNEPLALAATLGPLVRGVVDGHVRTAVLVASIADDAVSQIADAAGCRLLLASHWPAGFAEAVASQPGSPVLVMDCGVVLADGFWAQWAEVAPTLAQVAIKTRAQLPFGPGALGALGAKAARRLTGAVAYDEALILPASLAADLASRGADPWQERYRGRLARLKAASFRVGAPPGQDRGM